MTTISAKEAEVYDRQIRLWGVDAQKRMQESRVLFCGIDGIAVEVIKNLVLSGISVALRDDRPVTAPDLGANFFARDADIGSPRAAACLPRIQELNPFTKCTAVDGPSFEPGEAEVAAASAVVVSGAPRAAVDALSRRCREAGKPLFALFVHGLFGLALVDLGNHTYHNVGKGGSHDGPGQLVAYSAAHDVLGGDWGVFHRRLRFGLPSVAMALLAFAATERGPGEAAPTAEAAEATLVARGVTEPAKGVADVVRAVAGQWGAQLSPVCAVFGGAIAQEVLKGITGQRKPFGNVIAFDGRDGDATGVTVVA